MACYIDDVLSLLESILSFLIMLIEKSQSLVISRVGIHSYDLLGQLTNTDWH